MSKLYEISSIVFGCEIASLSGADTPKTIEVWDSMTHIILLSSLEEEFSVEFTDQEMISLQSLEAIRNNLEEKLGRPV